MEDQRRLAATLEALLSPLVSPTREGWYREVSRCLESLFEADATLAVTADRTGVSHFSQQVSALAREFDRHGRVERGALRSDIGSLDSDLVASRRYDARAFTSTMIDRLSGARFTRSDFYHEVVAPTGIRSSMGLNAVSPDGQVLLSMFSRRPEDATSEPVMLARLNLLVPAFRAGLEMLQQVGAARGAVAAALELAGDPMLLYDVGTSRELHRNLALRELAATDGKGDPVADAMLRLARRVAASGARVLVLDSSAPAAHLDVRTASAHYRLSASYLPPGIFGPQRAVLVAARRNRPALPSERDLMERWRLTAREAQVALALARGASDATIAGELRLSRHTVRHHAENVFAKLGVHSRKALALHLEPGALEHEYTRRISGP